MDEFGGVNSLLEAAAAIHFATYQECRHRLNRLRLDAVCDFTLVYPLALSGNAIFGGCHPFPCMLCAPSIILGTVDTI
eukprot:5401783-Amphidinium_carterae.1